MRNFFMLSIFIMALSGCSIVPYDKPHSSIKDESEVNEVFLEKSGNYSRLIDVYKERLKKEDSDEVRTKLAKVYIKINDNESALFVLAPVIMGKESNSEAFYLQGVAQYNLGRVAEASNSLEIAVNKSPIDAKSINMLGVALAEQGNLKEARELFNRARGLMYDDIVIKNNLALLDMLEGKFKEAATRLMPVYVNNPDKADAQLKANLAIIVSKLGSFESLRSLYGEQYSDSQLFDIFQSLRASVPVTRNRSSDLSLIDKKRPLAGLQVSAPLQKVKEVESPNEATSIPKQLPEEVVIVKKGGDDAIIAKPIAQSTQSDIVINDSAPSTLNQGPVNVTETAVQIPASMDHGEQKLGEEAKTALDVAETTHTQPYRDLPSLQEKSQVVKQRSVNKTRRIGLSEEQSMIEEAHDADNKEIDSRDAAIVQDAHDSLQERTEKVVNILDKTDMLDEPKASKATEASIRGVANLESRSRIRETESIVVKAMPSVSSEISSGQAIDTATHIDRQNSHSGRVSFVKLGDYYLSSENSIAIPIAPFRHVGELVDIVRDKQQTSSKLDGVE